MRVAGVTGKPNSLTLTLSQRERGPRAVGHEAEPRHQTREKIQPVGATRLRTRNPWKRREKNIPLSRNDLRPICPAPGRPARQRAQDR